MTKYELMFILDPTLDEEKTNATIDAVKGIIEGEGTLGEVDVWGLKKLAYPINKKAEGFYTVMQFESAPEFPKELDRRLKINDVVMRHIIINKDEK